MSIPFVFDGVALPGNRTAWLAGGLDPDGVVRSFSMEQTGSLIVNGMTTTESLTTSGGLITPATRTLNVDGDGLPVDSGYGIWPAATNLVTNGGAETNTTGVTAVSSTTTRTTAQFKFGAASFNVVTSNATANEGAYETFTATAAVYTVSAWVRGSGTVRMAVRDNSGANAQTGTPVTLSTTWQRITLTTTALTAATWRVYVETPTQQSTTFQFDGLQAELGSIATPYIETDGSTESRTGGRIQMPVADLFTETQGAVFAALNPGWSNANEPGGGTGEAYILSWADDANSRLSLFYGEANNRWESRRVASGTSVSDTYPAAITQGVTATICYAWEAARVRLSANGGAFISVAGTNIPTLSATSADIGAQAVFGGLSRHIASNMRWFATFAGTLTDDDAAALNAFGDTPPSVTQLFNALSAKSKPTSLWIAEDSGYLELEVPSYRVYTFI